MNKYKWIALMTLIIVASGCSNKQIYENLQRDALNQCRTLPASEYQECAERHSDSFETYTQQREELKK